MSVKNYEDRKAEIGKRIQAERKAKRLSIKEFLPKIYMSADSHKTVTAWEKGGRLPDLNTICLMADLFECDVGYLLCDYDEKRRVTVDICAETGLTGKAVTQLIEYDENVTAFISYLLSSGAINQIGLSVSQCLDKKSLNEHYRKVLSETPDPQSPLGDASDEVLDILSKRTKVIDEMKRLDEVYTSYLWRAEKDAGAAIETFIDREVEKYGKNE